MITLEEFKKNSDKFIIYKNDEVIYKSNEADLIPLLKFIKSDLSKESNLIIFDLYIGRAAALLMSRIKPEFVYTPMISKGGVAALVEYEIDFETIEMVDYLMGKASVGMCRWEKLSLGKQPEEFLELVKQELKI